MSSDRSPRYPAISLGDAIKLALELFEREGRAPVPEEVAVTHFGYAGLNGTSKKVLSALRKYGLVENVDGGVKVSSDAVAIAAHREDPDAPARVEAIQRAASRVELFRSLLNDLGRNASERNLVAQLVIRGFTQEGATRAAKAYRSTMALVDKVTTSKDPQENLENITKPQGAAELNVRPKSFESDVLPTTPLTRGETGFPVPSNIRREVFSLDEGDVTITFPDGLSSGSYDDLQGHFQLLLRKIARRVGAYPAQGPAGGDGAAQ